MMKLKHARTSLIVALLMAGCATQPNTTAPAPTANDPLGLGDAVAPNYQAMVGNAKILGLSNVNASSTGTEVTGVTASASSDRNAQWFAISNLTDDNLHSAWGPAATDTSPTVTLSLAQAATLNGLGIKMDTGATFDVATSTDGTTWNTIATNVTPQYRMLDFVGLPSTQAAQVRLTFHVQNQAQLLVCEVKLYSGAVGSPMPSAMPSTVSSCTSLTLNGDFFDTSGNSNEPPFLSIRVDASEYADGNVFGTSGASYSGSQHGFSGVVKSIQISGDMVTVITNDVDDSSGAISPGADVTIKAKITSRSGNTFDGYITKVDIPSLPNEDVNLPNPTGAFTLHGTLGACTSSPLNCFTLKGNSGFFDNFVGNAKGDVITLTNFTHLGTSTSGTITFSPTSDPNSGPAASGQIDSAIVSNDLLTLAGPLDGGGNFTVKFKIFDASGTTIRVAPTDLIETNASGQVTYSVGPVFIPDFSAGIDGTYGCQ
jgi:hypothetical protein